MKSIFIILFVFSFFLNSIAENRNILDEEQLNKLIETNFTTFGVPLRYYSNILIQLQGVPSKDDSLIFMELVDTLNLLIDKWDVYLIPRGTSNLIFEINPIKKPQEVIPFNDIHKNTREIISNKIVIKRLSSDTDFITRKKIIRYHLLRSLVIFKFNSNLVEKIPGSVFSVSEPDRITFNPVDFQIIKELYSEKYDNIVDGSSSVKSRVSTSRKKWQSMSMFGNLISILLSMFFLFYMFQKTKFTNHNYQFKSYLKQGLLVLIACYIYLFTNTFFVAITQIINFHTDASTRIKMLIFGTLLFALLGFTSIILLFFSERAILKGNDNLMLSILFPLLTILFIPSFLILLIFLIVSGAGDSKSPIDIINILMSSISFLGLLAIIRAFFIFMTKKSESIIHKKDVELAKLGELHKQAELQSIRSKINPHFLYNSLNSIASLAANDAQKTEKMALALSDFFKYSINREQKEFISVKEELNAVQTYLEIEKVRFGDRLNFEIICEHELMEIEIPQLLIQPLVENAIKHGLSKITEKGFLKIKVSKQNRKICIRVSDNGPAFPDGLLTGFGIRNTSERINLLFGKKGSINWENSPDKYIEIKLPI